MSIIKMTTYEFKREQIRKIAQNILQSNTVYETIEGKKYGFLTDKAIVYVKMMETSEVVNSQIHYDIIKGNDYNIALYLAKIVKIAMKLGEK